MSESNIENETIKTKNVRSIKSFFFAPKKIKLEVNKASNFDSPSDAINSKTTNVNKNIHHSTVMTIEHDTTNAEFSKSFKNNTNEQPNQELEKSNYSSSSSTCSSVDLCSSSYESADEIDESIFTNCEPELEYIVKPQSLRTVPGPYDISQTIDEEPYQPNLKNYPKTTYGTGRTKRTRSFQFCWYEQFKWIEYSQSENAVYCFPCRFFSLKQKNDSDSMFISTGYTNWKNAMSSRGFLRHDNSDEHKNCTISWVEFKKNKLNKTSVLSKLNNHHASIVIENKKYMEAIIISLRMLAIQGIAFRGHLENESSINQGNFLELMKVISLFDNVVKKKINGPKNARYLHHSIQKELIHIMASMIINKISSELDKSMYFAIMIDETKDITKTEQLSVVVRYYYNNEIKERFLGFTPLKKLDTYDGANVMRGSINGVQALFKNKVPHAVYIHCHNHRLNLVLVDVAKNVDEFIELQKQILKIPKPIELKRLCLTRWSSQIHTCRAVKATLEVILLLLYKISNEKVCVPQKLLVYLRT
ncbi:zinc finger MYM-type protein 1-like [Metopolophium dirhodum]|uniref:zinc finger MYM-type protein 1-like n=1 Tax=Metopolophium dirhodum TaxID=44670 RepID=UPI0029906C45|nr:zinc finger MYM-type protein 1-like [Metopolophium dirhodum]